MLLDFLAKSDIIGNMKQYLNEFVDESFIMGMGVFTFALVIIVIFVIVLGFRKSTSSKQNKFDAHLVVAHNVEEVVKVDSVKNSQYSYRLRRHLMTSYEEQVFGVLCDIFDGKCYVLPQVHLSKLLDHKVRGQSWQGAFAHINGKSVDFVLLRKRDLSPMCAIEIDDWTHRLDKRKERDAEIERMFANVGLPLVRLKYVEYMTKQEIVDQIAKTIRTV